MSNGRQAVGHPVDVGSGAVFTKRRDFALPGSLGLDWVRRYATDCDENSWLGRGWTVPYFMRLERQIQGWMLTDEIGRQLLFPCGEDRFDDSTVIAVLGANMELQRHPAHVEILHWHVASDDVERFGFLLPATAGEPMPLAWVENLAGHRITIEHDERGRPCAIRQDLEQRVLRLGFDDRDLLTTVDIVDAVAGAKRLVRYEYDEDRRMTASRDGLDHVCRYVYDGQHRLVQEVNPLGSSFHFRYDPTGRCIHTWGEDGYLERRLAYRTTPPMTKVTDSLGAVTHYYLNPAGQVIQEVSPLGATTTTEFDEHGRIVSIRQPGGGVVRHEYDDWGNRSAYVDELGARTEVRYNEFHLPVTVTEPGGSVWHYGYDARGNLMSLTNPLGFRLECRRDDLGRVIESRRPGGQVIRRSYGRSMRSIELSDQISTILALSVDECGHQIELNDARGLVRRLRNDALGRPVEMTDRLGRVVRLRYNAVGDLVERVRSGGQIEHWDYDAVGRLVAHRNAAGRLRLEYDSEDRLVAVVNRAGERLTRSYDVAGRLVSQTFFDGRVEHYEYHVHGKPVRVVRSDGRFVDLEYDAAGQLLARRGSDGLMQTFERDKNGRLIRAVSADADVSFERDPLGRVIAEIQNGRRIETVFDADNNRVRRLLPDLKECQLAMRYDMRGRLKDLADLQGICQSFAWGVGDELLERRLAGGAVERWGYDQGGRLQDHTLDSAAGHRVFAQHFEFDERDQVTAREDLYLGRTDFRYDDIGRLTAVRRAARPEETYRHDANGTLCETSEGVRPCAPGGRVQAAADRRYTYGVDGCVTTIAMPQGIQRLQHDVDGRLQSVTLPDGREVRYGYDALGRRVFKHVAGVRTDFVWQSCDLAAELRDGQPPVWHFHQNQTPLAQWHGTERLVPVTSPIGVPELMVSGDGKPCWRVDLDAYGRILDERGDNRSPFRFRGQYHDPETGLHYNLHRYYDSSLAGYLEPDPLGLSGGANFYAYPGNPMLWDDPFGLTCSNAHKGQMGESEMDAHYAAQGYAKLGSHSGPQGIDGVYHNPSGTPPYIIGEAKYGSSRLGSTLSGRQMSDNWIDSPVGHAGPSGATPSRLESAVGPTHAAAIQSAAVANPGSVQKQVFNLPAPGTSGSGSVSSTSNYNPGSGSTTFP